MYQPGLETLNIKATTQRTKEKRNEMHTVTGSDCHQKILSGE